MRRVGVPTVGRSVHYWPVAAMLQENPQPWHAVIIQIESAPGECQLAVFPPMPGLLIERRLARFAEEPTGGCWTWPEHVVVPEPEVDEGWGGFGPDRDEIEDG